MSKFCGVISNQTGERPQHEPPIVFQYLEMLADSLTSETEQLYGEFMTKCEFQQEQQNQIVDSDQKLRDMHDNMLALSAAVQAVEMEEQQNAAELEQLEVAVNTLERAITCERQQRRSETNGPHRPQSEHERVLDLLERTDNVMACLSTLMAELCECSEQTMQQQENPYNMICAILDFHVRTLQQTDKNLDTLQDKSTTIDESIRQLMEKITAATMKPIPELRNCSLSYSGSQTNFH